MDKFRQVPEERIKSLKTYELVSPDIDEETANKEICRRMAENIAMKLFIFNKVNKTPKKATNPVTGVEEDWILYESNLEFIIPYGERQ